MLSREIDKSTGILAYKNRSAGMEIMKGIKKIERFMEDLENMAT